MAGARAENAEGRVTFVIVRGAVSIVERKFMKNVDETAAEILGKRTHTWKAEIK